MRRFIGFSSRVTLFDVGYTIHGAVWQVFLPFYHIFYGYGQNDSMSGKIGQVLVENGMNLEGSRLNNIN